MNKFIPIVILIFIISSLIFAWQTFFTPEKESSLSEEITVYKTTQCGCCEVYANYLKRNGVKTSVIDVKDLLEIKNEYHVPLELSSCHTSIAGDYFIEGHIPLEVIEKLLEEKPNIAGIALPGMPQGTPGMPGPKVEKWVIYSIDHDGQVKEFIVL